VPADQPADVPTAPSVAPGEAWFAGRRGRGVVERVDVGAEPARLLTPGWWAVVGTFEGRVTAWRFAEVGPDRATADPARWHGPDAAAWTTSLDRDAYVAAVDHVRGDIREGRVYQANVCRVMSAPLAPPGADRGRGPVEPDARALHARLAAGNPAPFAGGVHVPGEAWVVTASPELFLRVETGAGTGVVTSGPIKGTAPTPAGLTDKDRAENVMITDLVRNDLQHVCAPGSVEVTELLAEQQHPGLVHLVSTVRGRLADPASPTLWRDLLDATYPPGSVSGAPKSSALDVVAELEPVPRGPYCGAVGWVEVAQDGALRAELAVAIRTFWWTAERGGTLRFGTGAGITWASDPAAEWAETELKAARLVGLASSR
jgi:para-aminobenzoate synthetase component 1